MAKGSRRRFNTHTKGERDDARPVSIVAPGHHIGYNNRGARLDHLTHWARECVLAGRS